MQNLRDGQLISQFVLITVLGMIEASGMTAIFMLQSRLRAMPKTWIQSSLE